jgi:uncharacterized protein with HEPN domain
MQGRTRDKIRLRHILDAIIEVENYSLDTDFSGFMKNSMMRFACIKQLEIIGEAGNHISNEIKASFSTIEWSQIIGMRNVFVHEYFGIDSKLVWDIIKNDLPGLKSKIAEILDSM